VIQARLIVNIPDERFRTVKGIVPKTGDLITIDQGFTFHDGKAGCLVHFVNSDGSFEYEAEVYESELGQNE
jgi:hypothetical protein